MGRARGVNNTNPQTIMSPGAACNPTFMALAARKAEKKAKQLEKARQHKSRCKERNNARDFKQCDYDAYESSPCAGTTVQANPQPQGSPAIEPTPSSSSNATEGAAATVRDRAQRTQPMRNAWRKDAAEEVDEEWVVLAGDLGVDLEAPEPVEIEPVEERSEGEAVAAGPLDYCPAPLAEFLVPSRRQLRREEWVDVQGMAVAVDA